MCSHLSKPLVEQREKVISGSTASLVDQALSVCDPGKLARHAGSLLQLAEALECPDFVSVSTLFSFVFVEFRFDFVKVSFSLTK